MRKPEQQIQTGDTELKKNKSELEIFAELSEAGPSDIEKFKRLVDSLPPLPEDSFDAALTVREHLIKEGWDYDDRFFCLQDILNNKKGNCLGLTLLYGSILRDKGYGVEYEILTGPRDLISKTELKYLEDLEQGDYFPYDKPILPQTAAANPQYRFMPLEHPLIKMDNKYLETTDLDEKTIDPNSKPKAEKIIPATFSDVASNVLTDRAKLLTAETNEELYQKSLILLNRALNLNPSNREAVAALWNLAINSNDGALAKECAERYAGIGGNDSRFYIIMYEMTKDENYLDLALRAYPACLEAFAEKKVVLEKDDKEAGFNFAVAAWCASNSNIMNLKRFYFQYSGQLKRLFPDFKY
jgi:tetratricopeptide (TPR) repeat protein